HTLPRSPLFPYTTLFRSSQAAILDYNRVLATIDQLIAVANEDEKTRRKRKDELENIKTNVCTLIRARKSDVLASILDQEVKELIDRKSTRLNSSHVKISY